MSVPVNQRTHGKLEVCVKAHDLCCYTLQITANKKNFTQEFQESLTNRIVEAAIDIHTLCWSANNILVNSVDDLRERTMYQEKAAIRCKDVKRNGLMLFEPYTHVTRDMTEQCCI